MSVINVVRPKVAKSRIDTYSASEDPAVSTSRVPYGGVGVYTCPEGVDVPILSGNYNRGQGEMG